MHRPDDNCLYKKLLQFGKHCLNWIRGIPSFPPGGLCRCFFWLMLPFHISTVDPIRLPLGRQWPCIRRVPLPLLLCKRWLAPPLSMPCLLHCGRSPGLYTLFFLDWNSISLSLCSLKVPPSTLWYPGSGKSTHGCSPVKTYSSGVTTIPMYPNLVDWNEGIP